MSRMLDEIREQPDLRALIAELWAEIEWFIDSSNTAKMFENAYGVAFIEVRPSRSSSKCQE